MSQSQTCFDQSKMSERMNDELATYEWMKAWLNSWIRSNQSLSNNLPFFSSLGQREWSAHTKKFFSFVFWRLLPIFHHTTPFLGRTNTQVIPIFITNWWNTLGNVVRRPRWNWYTQTKDRIRNFNKFETFHHKFMIRDNCSRMKHLSQASAIGRTPLEG